MIENNLWAKLKKIGKKPDVFEHRTVDKSKIHAFENNPDLRPGS